ncbi:MAG: hypothetical protein P9L90_00275 [Candidatus Aadella gelida]|nr:hypothetical protein [Candidatus Aadella gelida]
MPAGIGRGSGGGGKGGGRGRMDGNMPGLGSGGNCVCPECQLCVPHKAGIPCYDMKCPKCGSQMLRG